MRKVFVLEIVHFINEPTEALQIKLFAQNINLNSLSLSKYKSLKVRNMIFIQIYLSKIYLPHL